MPDIFGSAVHRRSPLHAFALILMMLLSAYVSADDTIPKLVYLIVDKEKLVAANIEFNRFDTIKLFGQETIVKTKVANAVIVVITNQRILGYSIYTPGWRTIDIGANESVESVTAEDYSALVVTSQRILSFNGRNGVWAQKSRQDIFH